MRTHSVQMTEADIEAVTVALDPHGKATPEQELLLVGVMDRMADIAHKVDVARLERAYARRPKDG